MPDSIQPPLTSSEYVIERLRAAILTGELPPGTRLVETELAERLGHSRGFVRTALARLAGESLVVMRPNRGAVVRELSGEDILEVYVLRSRLGDIAIREIIHGGTSGEVAAALQALHEPIASGWNPADQAEIIDVDLAFQSALIEACQLERVIDQFETLTAEVRLFILTTGIQYRDPQKVVAAQTELLEPLEAGDAEAAVGVWRSKIHVAVREFLDLLPDGEQIIADRPWVWELFD